MSFSSPLKPPASRRQNHDGLDGSCLRCVLCCNVDLIERVPAYQPVERQAALPVQFDEPWNESSRVAVTLIRADQANASTQQVRYVDGELRTQRRRADDNACSGGSERRYRLIENSQPAAGLDYVRCAQAAGQFEQR